MTFLDMLNLRFALFMLNGALGKARGDIFSSGPDVWMQTFERGKITHSAFHGATVTID
jgi:hypothetical protein